MDYNVGAKISGGNIVFSDNCDNKEMFIKAGEHVNLFINGEACRSLEEYTISNFDELKYTIDNSDSDRDVSIFVSEDKMQVSMRVEYFDEVHYKIKDTSIYTCKLLLDTEEADKKEADRYSQDDLRKMLKDKNITYGIDDEALKKAADGCNEAVVVAKGEYPVEDIPSEVKLFFTPTHMYFPDDESDEKVDYKNLFRISNVKKGDKIAEIIPEILGKDGKNVYGQTVKRPYIRLSPVTAKAGCTIENNDIIATIDGKAHISGRTVSVNPVYTVESVNMETCNINFYGDIEVYDSVSDNMDVNAGGSLDVSQNVNTSNVITGGDITILGNAIHSKILSGQIDIRKKEYADVLASYRNILVNLIETVKRENHGEEYFGTKDFIKNITDERYRDFQKIALRIVSFNIKNEIRGSYLSDYLKEKVLGYNILKMQSLNDLTMLKSIIESEISYYDKNSVVPLDIRLSYCQDCEIKSTGNIIITGKGEYTSVFTAMKDIMFTKSDSVARGGTLIAGNNITAGVVGSMAEIPTLLKVPKIGRISATCAYKNTTLAFDICKYTLDRTYHNMQAFYNNITHKIEVKDEAF